MDINEAKKLLDTKKEEVEKLKDYKNIYFWIFIVIPALVGLPLMIIGLIALGVWTLDALGFTFTFVGFSFIFFSGIFAVIFNKKRKQRQELITSLNKDIKDLENEIEEERAKEIKEIVETVKKNINELDEALVNKKISAKEHKEKKLEYLSVLEKIN